MSVKLLSSWGAQPAGTIYRSDSATESAMATAGVATADMSGAVEWQPPGNSRSVGPPSFTAAQAAALTYPPSSPVWSWSTWSGGASSSGLTDSTWQLEIAMPADPFAIRVTYINPLAATPVIDKTWIAASDTYVEDLDPTGGTAAATVTFGGAESVTLTTRPSAAECSFNPSDWTSFDSIARADVPGGLRIVHIRSRTVLGGQPYTDILGASAYAGNNVIGYIRSATTCSGNKTGALPTFYSGSNRGLCLTMAIEARLLGRALRLGAIGDSIPAGTTGAGTGIVSTFGEQACHLVNNQTIASGAVLPKFWSCMNFGWGGQSMAQIQQRLALVLATFPGLDAMLIPVWSPNSAPTTQAGANAVMSVFLGMVHQCVTAGVRPIPFTGTPYNALSSAADLLRKAANNAARAVAASNGFPLADIAAVVGDGGSVEQWRTGLSDDGLHPNEATKIIMARAVADVLPYAIPL